MNICGVLVHANPNKMTSVLGALAELEGVEVHRTADGGRIERPEGSSGYPPSLDLLVAGVRDVRDPEGAMIYFLRRLPRDPLNPEPTASAAESWGRRSYASPPDAPREGDDVYDVYSLATGSGLDGVPYREW